MHLLDREKLLTIWLQNVLEAGASNIFILYAFELKLLKAHYKLEPGTENKGNINIYPLLERKNFKNNTCFLKKSSLNLLSYILISSSKKKGEIQR